MSTTSYLRISSLVLTLGLSACGTKVGFEIADQDKDKDVAEREAKENVILDVQPLVVSTEAEPTGQNEVSMAEIASVEATFDYKVEQAANVKLVILSFKPNKCGDVDSVSPTFQWAEVHADGTLGEFNGIDAQTNYQVAAGTTQRLKVKMKTSFGTCATLLLRFKAYSYAL